jgi:hypothetical protein
VLEADWIDNNNKVRFRIEAGKVRIPLIIAELFIFTAE